MKRIKWISVIVAPLLIFSIARFCHHQTSGFKITKIEDNFPSYSQKLSPLPKDLKEVLSQKFSYLGRGLQSFAFVSEDQTTVLKIFNNRYQRKIFWYSHLPGQSEKISYLKGKLERLKSSYELSQNLLKDETSLLYLHLAPSTTLNKRVTLIDRLGIEHPFDLDTHGFLLQKRGTLAYAHINNLMDAGRPGDAKIALTSLLELILNRCKKGIHDNDSLIRTNLGFIENRPFYIDVGPFSKSSAIAEPKNYSVEIIRITESLRRWLETHHPSLSADFENTLNTALSNE